MTNLGLKQQEIWDRLKVIIQEHSPFRVQPELSSRFNTDLAIDSLGFVAMIAQVESDFSIAIAPNEMIETFDACAEKLLKLTQNRMWQEE